MLTVTLWAVSPSALKYLRELDLTAKDYEERVRQTTAAAPTDMSEHGWIPIGTVTYQFNLDLGDKALQAAVGVYDKMEEKLREKFNTDLQAINVAKQEFLALPNLTEQS